MTKLWKLVLAGLLVTAAIVSLPSNAVATDWCALCQQEPAGTPMSCYYCCKCDGVATNVCLNTCVGSGH
jgi:hypothetical protein